MYLEHRSQRYRAPDAVRYRATSGHLSTESPDRITLPLLVDQASMLDRNGSDARAVSAHPTLNRPVDLARVWL
jgi:hypothetical protein